MAFPPRVDGNGHIAWSTGEASVRESIRIILLTEQRERLQLPEFGAGLGQLLFEHNAPATYQLVRDRIQRALVDWEPRIRVESVAVDPDPRDTAAAIATITYRLVATSALERVSLRVGLGAQGES